MPNPAQTWAIFDPSGEIAWQPNEPGIARTKDVVLKLFCRHRAFGWEEYKSEGYSIMPVTITQTPEGDIND